jgi:hypothetical protein
MDGIWNAEFDSAGPTFVILAMTPPTFMGRGIRPLLAFMALAGAAGLRSQEYPGLAPFITAVPGQPDVSVEAAAEAALLTRIASIVDKPQPSPTGDARDYVSYARYYWPNPDTSNHLPFVRRDGHSNEEQVALGDESRLMKMDETVGELALGWAVYHRESYALRAGEWLRAWFVDPATAMHPNLERGQIALGHDENRGRGEGILDAREFIGLVDALRMLHGAPGLPAADEGAIHAWFGEYLHWMLTSKIGNAEHAAANNHGSWFLAQAIAIARYVGRDDIARGLANEDFARIASQIRADGRQPLELARADSLTYSAFNLTAQFLVARLSVGLGVDVYHYTAANGASLAKAVEFLRPYNLDLSKWQGSQVRKVEPGFLDQILADEDLLASARK